MNAEPAAEPEDAAKPGDGKWLPEDYFRPLSAVRNPADKKAQWARNVQEDKEARWDEQIPWDEQAPLRERVQPDEQAQPDVLKAPRPWHRGTSGLAASVVALVIVASVGIALFLGSSSGAGHSNGGQPASAAQIRDQAAAWVAQQVSRHAVVSCDHTMCSALAKDHFPAGNLHVLESTSSNPAGSTVIVATPTVRSQFGSRLDSSLAPLVLATFGSGSTQIDVRLIAPHGAAALRKALASDVTVREVAGAELLGNRRIHASAAARKQIAAGNVDSRLLIVIAVMAAQQPLDVVAFSDSGPGANPGLPLRVADLAETNGMAQPAWTRSMLALLQAQGDTYLPAKDGTTLRTGNTVFFVQFAAPSPLGLLSPSSP